MRMAVGLTRRQALRWLLTAGGVGVAAGEVPQRALRRTGAPAQRRLLEMLHHRESARAIGRAFLSRHPGERDAAALERRLAESLRDDGVRLAQAGDGELRRWLSVRVRRDFADDRVVVVDGWILAATEARLCALVALRRPG